MYVGMVGGGGTAESKQKKRKKGSFFGREADLGTGTMEADVSECHPRRLPRNERRWCAQGSERAMEAFARWRRTTNRRCHMRDLIWFEIIVR